MIRNIFNSFYIPVRPHSIRGTRNLFVASIGNPEPEYKDTRHNVGHRFFDYVTAQWADHLVPSGDYYTSTKYPHLVLYKSNKSYMNLQGRPISKHFKQAGSHDGLVIIHDELQVDLGKLQIRKPGTSARGHNGLKSINSFLPNTYTKVAIGIGRPLDRSKVVEFVLERFTDEELEKIDVEVFPKVIKELEKLVAVSRPKGD